MLICIKERFSKQLLSRLGQFKRIQFIIDLSMAKKALDNTTTTLYVLEVPTLARRSLCSMWQGQQISFNLCASAFLPNLTEQYAKLLDSIQKQSQALRMADVHFCCLRHNK